MPPVQLTVTFKETGKNIFDGFVSESPVILPDDPQHSFEVKGQQRLTPWGSIAFDVFDGELIDIHIQGGVQPIHFEKSSDQLTGHHVFFQGKFNAAAATMDGIWNIIDCMTSELPPEIKHGTFSLWKPEDGRRSPDPKVAPVSPQLIVV